MYQANTDQKLNLNMFNAIGQNMYGESFSVNAGLSTLTIDVQAFAKGMYIIDLKNILNGIKFQSKFVKE